MPAAVTSNFRISNAKQFVDSFEEPENGGRSTIVGKSYVYLFVGKILSWDKTHAGYSDTVIPSPDVDVQGNEFEPWRDMIALERVIANTDISFGAQRYDWVSGTVYTPYDDQNPAITKSTTTNGFYVFEPDVEAVFKCLDNNNGAVSTVRPTEKGEPIKHEPFVTSDGYRWKFMYQIPASASKKFLSTNYIPVRTLNAMPGSSLTGVAADTALDGADHNPVGYDDQALVQRRANNGTLETYVVISGGDGFTAHSGAIDAEDRTIDTTMQEVTSGSAVSNNRFFSLSSGVNVSGIEDFYNGAVIFVSNNSVQKGIGWIEDYGILNGDGVVGQQRTVFLNPGLAPEMHVYDGEVGVKYDIGPRINVDGDGPQNADGSGGANAYSICTKSGVIKQIRAWKSGNNYTTANVTTIGVLGGGSGLVARAIIPPPGGHGSDPVAELNGFNIIISKTISGAGLDNPATSREVTGNNFPISNQYRTLGLIKNAYLANGYDSSVLGVAPSTSGKNWYANSSPLHQSLWIVANTETAATSENWTPAPDDEIKGVTSLATGRVIEFDADGRNILNITNITTNTSGGSFMGNERIGLLRNATGTPSSGYTTNYITANGDVRDGSNGPLPHDGLSIVKYEPDLQPYTGDILYIENRTPITRSGDQAEDIKIVIEF